MATLSIKPNVVLKVHRTRQLATEHPSGQVQTRSAWEGRSRKAWQLGFFLTEAERAALVSAFNGTNGVGGIFQFTPPGEPSLIDVRFRMGTLQVSALSRHRSFAEIEIEALRPTVTGV